MCDTENWVRSKYSIGVSFDRIDCFSLNSKFEVNIWSSFEIKGNPDMTLEGFMTEVEVC